MTSTSETKRVFIGGISGGIGSAVANVLSSENWTVGGYGRPSDRWSEFVENHPDFKLYEADATDATAVEQAFAGKRVLVTGHTGFKGAWMIPAECQ